jgi:hypothetical protein
MLVMGSSRGRVLVFSTRGDTPVQVARIDSDKEKGCSSVQLCSEGKYIFCASALRETWSKVGVEDFEVCLRGTMHVGAGECKCKQTRAGIYRCKRCPIPLQHYTAMDVSSAGERVATGDHVGTVVLWDSDTAAPLQFLRAHSSRISSVSFTTDGLQLLSTSNQGCLIIWDTVTATMLHTIDDARSIDWARFSPIINGGFAVHRTSIDDDMPTATSTLEMFQYDGKQEPTNLFVRVDMAPSFGTFSGSGLFIATRSKHGVGYNSVALVNSGTGVSRDLVYERSGHITPHRPSAVAFSPDSSQLAVSYIAQHFILWCTRTARIAKLFTTRDLVHWGDHVTSLSWGHDYVHEKTVIVSFAMGLHPRLGVSSLVMTLDKELMRMIISYI